MVDEHSTTRPWSGVYSIGMASHCFVGRSLVRAAQVAFQHLSCCPYHTKTPNENAATHVPQRKLPRIRCCARKALRRFLQVASLTRKTSQPVHLRWGSRSVPHFVAALPRPRHARTQGAFFSCISANRVPSRHHAQCAIVTEALAVVE